MRLFDSIDKAKGNVVTMSDRRVILRRGRHTGWWVEGRWGSGRLFMMTWWPTQGMARTVARWFGGPAEVVGAGTA